MRGKHEVRMYADKTPTSVLPKAPTAFKRNLGGALARGARPSGGGGLPMMDKCSLEGSNSESASRSHDDYMRTS